MEFSNDCRSTEHVDLEFSDLGGMPIDILKVYNQNTSNNLQKEIVIVIPGNPGIVRYYTTFIKALHKELGNSIPVWAVSHACHSIQKLHKYDSFDNNRLEIEIEHKLRFLEQKVPLDCKINLIGHSIGCFMILSILEILAGHRNRPNINHFDNPANEIQSEKDKLNLLSRINKCYLLFPTIERMKVSPNGKRLWPVLNYLQWLVVGLISIVSWLPYGLRNKIASLALSVKSTDAAIIESTVDLITPNMFGNMMQLAHEELSSVNVLHAHSIESLKEKLVFYFGTSDGWCPLSYRNDLVKLIPDLQNYIDDQRVEHAFVVTHSYTMASTLAKIFNDN